MGMGVMQAQSAGLGTLHDSRQEKVTSPGSGLVRRACVRKRLCRKYGDSTQGPCLYGSRQVLVLECPQLRFRYARIRYSRDLS